MKKPFQIIKTSVYGNYVTFRLDNNLDYKDKSINSITVYNKPPFTGYKVGDDIVIDTAAVAGHPRSAVFGEGQVRKEGSWY